MQAAEQSGVAAPGGADQGRNRLFFKKRRNALQGMERTIIQVQLFNGNGRQEVSPLTKSSGDIIFGSFIRGVGEEFVSRAVFYQLSQKEEGHLV